jgi:photosystem II stability/assembly factor-like uncharacterized protein
MRTSKPPAVHSRAPQKDRTLWFYQNASFPMRDAPPVELEKFWSTRLLADISPERQWQCLGPDNVAGRVTALVIHPDNPNKWFAGSATGGVWVSHNAGESWKPAWSPFANQNIGALAYVNFTGELKTNFQGKANLVAATGEANMYGDSYPGSGVYLSNDDGLTWQPFFGPPQGTSASIEEDVRTFPRRIGSLALAENGAIAIGSVFLDDSLPAGLYLYNPASKGSGMGPCQFWGQRSYNCHSVLFHPHDKHTIFASIEPDGSLNGIWRSRDFGNSWKHLTKGLPSGDQFRRISLAFAPCDPDVIYALAADRSDYVLGVFRSTNGGNSWREILGGRYPKERQMSYNNTIAVHPRKPECAIWGGMHLYRTDDGGRNWRRTTNLERGKRDYVHGDHHAVLWPEDDLIVSGNDGGVSVSRDGGRTWTERSRGMVTTMFYNLDVAPSSGKVFGGGTQDNGILIAGVEDCKERDFFPAISGDGAWIVFDPAEKANVFACITGFEVYRHLKGKPWDYAHWKQVKPRQISARESGQRAFTVLAIEPSTHHGVKTLWAGSNRLWRTDNNGQRWRPVSGSFDGSPISAIEIARARPRLMFVGTTRGGIFRSRDGGLTWSQTLSCAEIPARPITSIQTHPKFAATVVVTVASTGIRSSGVQLQTGDDLPYRHVFRSRDMGNTWEDIDGGALPNVVFYAAAYETHHPYRLFVAGDAGVWVETDGKWLNFSGNLPNVVVSDLVYHHKDRTLTAATYGRGVWRMRPGSLVTPAATTGLVPEQIAIASGLRVDPRVAAPVPLTPPDGVVLDNPGQQTLVTLPPVPGALGYQLEFIAAEGFNFGTSSITPEIQLPGVGNGKWRVWAVFPDGLRSAASEWRRIGYRQQST